MLLKRENENFIQETLLDKLMEDVEDQLADTEYDLLTAVILTDVDSTTQGVHARFTIAKGEAERTLDAVVTVNGTYLLTPLFDNDALPTIDALFR